jgi:hypothetical protein
MASTDFWSRLRGNTDEDSDNTPESSKSLANPTKLIQGGIPSTEELQDTKQQREDYINSLHDKAVASGYPTMGSAFAAGASSLNDILSPNTREDYVMGMAPMGTLGKAGGAAATEAEGALKPGIKALRDKMPSFRGNQASIAYKEGLSNPEALEAFAKDPQAAEQARLAAEKINRKGAQDLSDARAGITKKGSTNVDSPDFPDRDYSQLNAPAPEAPTPVDNSPSPYKMYQPMKKTEASTGWQSWPTNSTITRVK